MYKQREGLLPVPLYVLQVRTTHIRAHEMRYIFVCTVTGLECRDTFTYTVWHVARVSDSHSTTRRSAENLTECWRLFWSNHSFEFFLVSSIMVCLHAYAPSCILRPC